MFDTLIGLILIALCGYAMFLYIGSNARGEGYFSRFHASDLSSIAQIAASADGDVVLKYDNLRPDLDLAFWFENGKVSVGTPQRSLSPVGLIGEDRQAALPDSITKPPSAAVGRYAPVLSYRPATLDRPARVIATRTGPTLTIQDGIAAPDTCPVTVSPQIPIQDARVWLEIAGSATQSERDEAIAAFRDTIGQSRIALATTREEATIRVTVTHESGTTSRLSAGAGGADATAIACDTAQQLRQLTLADIAFTPSVPTGASTVDAQLTLMIANTDRIRPTQIGKGIAYAILGRYRS